MSAAPGSLPHGIRRAFRLALRRPRLEQEIDAEIAFHLQMRAAELEARGYDPEAARAEARRRFGDIRHWSHAMSDVDRARAERAERAEWWSGLGRDLRHTVRGLRRQPVFTVGVVLTLALGIGANAIMFGIVDRLLLRPPPHVVHAEQIRRLYRVSTSEGGVEETTASMPYSAFAALRDSSRSFASLAVWSPQSMPLGRGDGAREIDGAMVSASFFPTLGVRPYLGRFFTEAEDTPPTGERVAVLGYELWRSEYGGDSSAIGRTIVLRGDDYRIVGVAPPGFAGAGLQRVDAWLPVSAVSGEMLAPFLRGRPWWEVRGVGWLRMLGRLAPGVTDAQAEAELAVLFPRYLLGGPDPRKAEDVARGRPHVVLGGIQAERGPERSASARVATWLLGVSAFVLVIACANVANLLLARAARRRREIAVRLALGVGRARLAAQLLAESVLLALLGGAAGLLVAQWGGALVRGVILPDVAWDGALGDRRVLAFTMLAALLTGTLAGLVPALQASRPDLAGALKAGAREGGGRRSRTRTLLLVVQAALSAVLLVGAGLFVRSLANVTNTRLGWEPERLLVLEERLAEAGYSDDEVLAIYDRLLERVRTLPGVASASVTTTLPFQTNWTIDLQVPGLDSVPLLPGGEPLLNLATPEFLRTLGVRVVRGRGFTAGDRPGTGHVVVVNETAARRLWPGREALGQCVKLGAADTLPCSTVVGVVEDVRWDDLRAEPRLQLYGVLGQQPEEIPLRTLVVRTAGDVDGVARAIERAAYEVAPRLVFVRATPLAASLEPELRPWRLGASMFTAFGALALVIAAVGLYSVLAYAVAQRTQELGVRLALGAGAGAVLRLIVGEGLRVVTSGVVLGLVAALLLGRRLEALLFDVSPHDPLVVGGVAAALLLVAFLASVVPAWRATRVDPNVALRTE
ncbi:MAG TPA: ABC transporter permease [Gemmatimonadaceae bacterium]|nr:ABC transporter permease [Gemmatimonadaceae bacterium]